MRTREEIEALEEQILAPFAMKAKYSLGRVYEEPSHAIRTCYQRDRDRIIHCEAFRKLEYKTQVFVIFEGDYYRTRLTHTLEVAQIAKTVGRALSLNEDLIEAIALAHDLGHPPFGHAGEEALDAIMKEARLAGFNHNKHSFDIVTKLEKRYPHFDGLNLTKEVLVGILKHKTDYDVPEMEPQYADASPALEALVVDFADSLAYLNHDIDDGLTSGCLTQEDLMESTLWQRAYASVREKVQPLEKEMLKVQIVIELIDLQIKDLLAFTDHRLQAVPLQNVPTLKDHQQKLIGFSPSMSAERDFLQSLINEKLYHHYRVVRMTSKAQRIIRDLFSVYLKEPMQLPYSIYQRHRRFSKEEQFHIICHYIAGMTDRFAIEEHKKLFDPYQKV